MGSAMIFKARICLKLLQPINRQRSSGFLTMKTALCKSSQLPLIARFLCTRDAKPSLGGTLTDGQVETKNKTIRQKKEHLWGDTVDGKDKSFTLQRRSSFSKSVFAAGTAKKTAEILKRKAAQFSEVKDEPERRTTRGTEKLQPPDRPLSVTEWRELKESLGNWKRFDIQMMCSLLNSGAELDIAKSLLTFVAMETGTLSYELLLNYLILCVRGGHDTEAFDVYEIMRGTFPCLDTGASTLFIKSFSRTERWSEAVSILNEVKKIFTPSSRNYSDVIEAALTHGDLTTAWALYDELIEKGLSPHQETWEALFKGSGKTNGSDVKEEGTISESEHQERLLEVLLYMRNNQIYPQKNLATSIRTWFESLRGQKWTASWTTTTLQGVCRCCGSELESIHLTAEEYQQLKDRVMTDIIQGQDVFNKTTPEELEQFKAFVKRRPAFDVVIDGLNVANVNKDKSSLSEKLLTVVLDLERQGLTVLVLGRKHMLRPSRSWERHHMTLIQQKAHCFFTDNISEDDPFLLYATLHSGNHCRFVSRDLMRDHKACLRDGATRRLFFKWQRGHQMVVDGPVTVGRRVRFQRIPSYDTIIQTSGDMWHVPYDDTQDRSTYEVPQQWLCLTRKH